MKKLLFIDTNIYLDFYRIRNDVSVSLLEKLDGVRDRIIVTHQIEMEFKKHRQDAILEAMGQLKPPTNIPRPAVISEHKSYVALQADLKRCSKRIAKLKSRLQRLFENPVRHDPVYKVVQRILTKEDELNLTRSSKMKHRIRRAAFRRFLLGYPPRKKDDTSIGDAVNWEWICEVCKSQNAEVIIVSRDSDYGITHEDKSYINDWLDEEFRDRISLQREVRLTSKLSDALRHFEVAVTPEQEKVESDFIRDLERHEPTAAELSTWLWPQEKAKSSYSDQLAAEALKTWMKNG
jgi:hypothetical protein